MMDHAGVLMFQVSTLTGPTVIQCIIQTLQTYVFMLSQSHIHIPNKGVRNEGTEEHGPVVYSSG